MRAGDLTNLDRTVDRRSRAIGAAGILAVTLAYLSAAAEANELIATIEHPATITVAVAPGPDSARAGRNVVVDVTAYTPPKASFKGLSPSRKTPTVRSKRSAASASFPIPNFRRPIPPRSGGTPSHCR